MAESNNIKKEKPIKKKIKKEEKEPILKILTSFYSNGIRINYSKNEIIIEYFQNPVQDNGMVDCIRLILLPGFFKKINEIYSELIVKYEKEFGKIKEDNIKEKK